jgi:alanyl-tRNA synthetase
MTSNEIRASFLRYFEQQRHRIVPSSPLVPGDDPTLLFTNAGMNQFKDVFTGSDRRPYTRAASAQKCVRAGGKHNDLENVGRTARHLTFFEMLGNFSFGDYFKADAIRFAWDLLVNVWKLDTNRLWFSVFEGEGPIPADDEAAALWVQAGAGPNRVLRFGKKDNFWSMGDTGPCGPCSEIHYFRGPDLSKNLPSLVNGPGDDTMEIWNLVFMQYDRDQGGTLTPLPAPSIDTGAGLERLTTIVQNVSTVYDVDSFRTIMRAIADISGHSYGGDMADDRDTAARVICDHGRSTTFLINDGVIPSNEGRGYVLRKIMRRAMRHGRRLGLTEPFLHTLVAVLAREMGDAYPELRTNRGMIEKAILAEEKRFGTVLAEGLPKLEAEVTRALENPQRMLGGEAAFRLYDTFGMPYDFIDDTAATQGVGVDRAGFDRAMAGQRDRARAQSAFGIRGTNVQLGVPAGDMAGFDDGLFWNAGSANFVGYESTRVSDARVVLLWNEKGEAVETLGSGQSGYMALARTPFYVESGGQVDDRGTIDNVTQPGRAWVVGMLKQPSSYPRAHRISVSHGHFRISDVVVAEVDPDLRAATRRNHTATHLLHAALRQVLGTHVKQAGSLVAPERLRFDFVHVQPVTPDEIREIEEIVNSEIVKNITVVTEVRATEEAIASGATALFGEKYGDAVRVVSVPGFSLELCGGTHVRATGDIGAFMIESESGVAAGVRRIEALTGLGALTWAQGERATLGRLVGALRVGRDQALDAIERLQADAKRLAREVTELRTKVALGGGPSADASERLDVAGVALVRRRIPALDKDALRNLSDSLKSMIKSGVVVLVSEQDGKVQIVAAVTPDLTSRIKAGSIVKELAPIVGGGGGGRPDFAEAGGRHPEKIDDLLAAAPEVVKRLLG